MTKSLPLLTSLLSSHLISRSLFLPWTDRMIGWRKLFRRPKRSTTMQSTGDWSLSTWTALELQDNASEDGPSYSLDSLGNLDPFWPRGPPKRCPVSPVSLTLSSSVRTISWRKSIDLSQIRTEKMFAGEWLPSGWAIEPLQNAADDGRSSLSPIEPIGFLMRSVQVSSPLPPSHCSSSLGSQAPHCCSWVNHQQQDQLEAGLGGDGREWSSTFTVSWSLAQLVNQGPHVLGRTGLSSGKDHHSKHQVLVKIREEGGLATYV